MARQIEPLRVRCCDDLELWREILPHGNLVVTDEPLFNFRLVNTPETARAGWRQARLNLRHSTPSRSIA
ncbi:MAG: hypothetical protein LBD30_08550 [Verrucomicrobiales bacterium]|nr:hypothetical protein [Verrucomicrobiales bacterium]